MAFVVGFRLAAESTRSQCLFFMGNSGIRPNQSTTYFRPFSTSNRSCVYLELVLAWLLYMKDHSAVRGLQVSCRALTGRAVAHETRAVR